MDLGLKGKIALVTGSSRGLGYATALELAREGARVAVNSRAKDKAEAAAARIHADTGADAVGLEGDLSSADVPARLVQGVVQAFGGLDILVTNAGGPPPGAFEQIDDETWYKAIETTLMAHVRLIRAALPYLRKSQTPAVLTITSYSVKQPIPNLILSNSIRAATVSLTKSLALELGAEHIRFNSILPARTMTERIQSLDEANAKRKGIPVEEETRSQNEKIPLGRASTPEEFAKPAAFLVSPAAIYITGLMFSVDGGAYKATY